MTSKKRAPRNSNKNDGRLNALRNRIRGALKEALGKQWGSLAKLKVVASMRRIELNFSTTLNNSRLQRAMEKLKKVVADFRGATYFKDSQVIHLA